MFKTGKKVKEDKLYSGRIRNARSANQTEVTLPFDFLQDWNLQRASKVNLKWRIPKDPIKLKLQIVKKKNAKTRKNLL